MTSGWWKSLDLSEILGGNMLPSPPRIPLLRTRNHPDLMPHGLMHALAGAVNGRGHPGAHVQANRSTNVEDDLHQPNSAASTETVLNGASVAQDQSQFNRAASPDRHIPHAAEHTIGYSSDCSSVPSSRTSSRTPTPTPTNDAVHYSVACDQCSMAPIVGARYNLGGHDYDLCHRCFISRPQIERARYMRVQLQYAYHSALPILNCAEPAGSQHRHVTATMNSSNLGAIAQIVSSSSSSRTSKSPTTINNTRTTTPIDLDATSPSNGRRKHERMQQTKAAPLSDQHQDIREQGEWAVWVLEAGARERNKAIREFDLTEEEAKHLKITSRRRKLRGAQRRYLAGLKRKEQAALMVNTSPQNSDDDSAQGDERSTGCSGYEHESNSPPPNMESEQSVEESAEMLSPALMMIQDKVGSEMKLPTLPYQALESISSNCKPTLFSC
jgi:hypothetical protein